MILILSKGSHEETTDHVIDWLRYFKANFIRLNGEEFVRSIFVDENYKIWVKGVDLSEINVCWFRRWISDEIFMDILQGSSFTTENYWSFFNALPRELNVLSRLFWAELSRKKWLTHPSEINISKLEVLKLAGSVGLSLPPTIVTTCKKELASFMMKHTRVITKCLGDIRFFFGTSSPYSPKTTEISASFFETLEETFFPSLFQKLIEKEYELRSFYIADRLFTMAIFSQSNEKTKVDFRNYDFKKPNRQVPYLLPNSIKTKIITLLKQLNISTCSVDLIKERGSDQYYFLEVNPIGQLGMTSAPCNYFLEKEIAQYLIENDRQEF